MSGLIHFFRRNNAGSDFETLLAPHVERLYRLAYRFTGSRANAEDLMQDMLLRLYRQRSELARIEPLGPWLARVLYNRFIDTVRHTNHDPLHAAASEETLLNTEAYIASPDAESDSTELQQHLTKALDDLRPDQRVLVVLHDMEGYTLNELCDLLDIPMGTLKSRLHRARNYLRKALSGEPFIEQLRIKG